MFGGSRTGSPNVTVAGDGGWSRNEKVRPSLPPSHGSRRIAASRSAADTSDGVALAPHPTWPWSSRMESLVGRASCAQAACDRRPRRGASIIRSGAAFVRQRMDSGRRRLRRCLSAPRGGHCIMALGGWAPAHTAASTTGEAESTCRHGRAGIRVPATSSVQPGSSTRTGFRPLQPEQRDRGRFSRTVGGRSSIDRVSTRRFSTAPVLHGPRRLPSHH